MNYAVTAKCGHTGFGRGTFIPVVFGVQAPSARDAAQKARQLPRVKHHHKDAIIAVREVDDEAFRHICRSNRQDLFLLVHSIQEQRRAIPIDDLLGRVHQEPARKHPAQCEPDSARAAYFAGKTSVAKPHKYHRYQNPDRCRLSRVSCLPSA